MVRRVFILVAVVALVGAARPGLSAHAQGTGLEHRPFKAVCGIPAPGFPQCHAAAVTDSAGAPLTGTAPVAGSYGPQQFHRAYNLPCTPDGAPSAACAAPSSFGPRTIAVVIAYNYPTAESDLTAYSSQFGIPACTAANGCLSIVDQNGGSSLPATVDSNWSLEAAMDLQTAHEICQTCRILLVEAATNSWSNLSTAVATAARLGATAISNSYGAPEWSGESAYDAAYNQPGIAVVASSGDGGYGSEYPAAAPGVVAVGGTTLQLNADSSYASETAWSGAGSGCSGYEGASTWQTSVATWAGTGCQSSRGTADVAADADPSTGAAVYDSTTYNGSVGWHMVGGTSLAAPLVAGVYALAGGVPAGTTASSVPYAHASGGTFHDVVAGTTGTCTTTMCAAAPGYDGPTGLGSPNGTAGFGGTTAPAPTATVAPTSTATPAPIETAVASPTPVPTSTQAPTPTATAACTQKAHCKK